MAPLSRRSFLASGAAGIMASLPATVYAQASTMADALTLRAVRRTIEVDGRAASVLGLVDGSGRPGLMLDPGQRFRVDLTNDLDVETMVHWHGQIPPNAQDGVSNTNPMLPAGGSRSFDFAPRTGTFWMHSHVPARRSISSLRP
jgi:FtsP/CotA-like multicopper oxidase with cupredoxin domain